MNSQFIVYFISQSSRYAYCDRYEPPPMRRIQPEEIVCYCTTFDNTSMIVDALNDIGLI
jgi:hypothetical protein